MNLINLKIAFRSLLKNKLLTFLNIAGLATGLAVAIVIFNYSYHESRADKHHEHLKDIYVLQNGKAAHVVYEMASLIEEQIPGVKYISMVQSNFKSDFVLINEYQSSIKSEVVFADNNFTKIFSFELISGNLEEALSEPQSIILSESESKKLFKNENPIGKTLMLKGNVFFLGESNVEVKAVVKDMPQNSNIQFKSLISFVTANKMMPWMDQCVWGCSNVQNYVLLENGQEPELLAAQMNKQLRPLIPEKAKCDFSFLPYEEVYFSSIRDDFKHGNLRLIYTLVSIAVLILLIAIINYINLSIAGSSKRLTEVGVRKVVGAKPVHVIGQLLGESVMVSIIAMTIAVFIARLLTPAVNNLSIIDLPVLPLSSLSYWAVFVAGATVIGLFAGILPALSFSRFRPISLISGRLKNLNQGINLKRALIVFQFAISIILIICTLTVTRQLSLVRNTDIGFEVENIINAKLSPEVKIETFRDELQKIPGVEGVSFSRWFPGNIGENWGMTLVNNGVETKVTVAVENADANYIDLMGLEIVKGRKFSESIQSDIGSAILNEAAVETFGLEDPLEGGLKTKKENMDILGVVKNFNFQSLHNQIKPLVLIYANKDLFSVNIKLASGDFESITKTLDDIRRSWKAISPSFPFEFKFIDAEIENLYRTELIFGKIFRYGSAFAIFISCLGLFGLVLGATEQRQKEIGIRKVNGARVSEILVMLNKDFVKWVGIAFVLACPIAYYFMSKWLENFAYKTNLSWWIFALAGVLALGIALLTVSFQSYKAATRNPVESLRYE